MKREIRYDILEKMNNTARHRGPDDEGYMAITDNLSYPLRGGDTCTELSDLACISDFKMKAFLAFGHRRLSIIDLSVAGHQPMQKISRGICVTYNGEIYNYIELRQELEKMGYSFLTQSDTEVLLCAYEAWGENCVAHFNGMWGFAIWDSQENKLFCSRDRLGAKPFYYYKNEDSFFFSSELKQLCANPAIPRKLNENIMAIQIMWGIADFSEETLIKDMFSLPGGSNLVIRLDESREHILDFSIYPYWEIDTETKAESPHLYEHLRDAIRIRTRSDAPIGVLLSGGLDSSVLVAEIGEFYEEQGKERSELNTFTSCYHEFPEGDEKAFAENVNDYCGTTPNYLYPDEQDTYKWFEKMVWHYEGHFNFSCMGSFMTLKQVADSGVKVLINGQGSDELLLGYEKYYAYFLKDLIKHGKFLKAIKGFLKAYQNSGMTVVSLLKFIAYFPFPSVRKRYCFNKIKRYVTNKTKELFNNKTVYQYLFFDSLSKLQFNELRRTSLRTILRLDDRGYMAFSLESRVPYIDYRYIEDAVEIREEEKIQNGWTKYPLRKFIDKRLPDEVVWRKNKMGWPSPKERWVSRFSEECVQDLFEHARCSKYFNISELKKLYQVRPSAGPIEKFMIIETFVRLFDVAIE